MSPAPGTKVPDGSTVTLFYSDGPESVPNVIGKTEDAARKLIEDAGFQVSVVHDSTTVATKGDVLDQSPKSGTTETKGSTVTIVVSTYEAPSSSPSPSESPSGTPTGLPTP
jgi:serine/threonine-protein kinase